MLRIKVDKKLAELLRVGYGGSKFDDEMAKLIDAATRFWAKQMEYEILYGKDSVNFAGQPRTPRELDNNVRLCRIAQERERPALIGGGYWVHQYFVDEMEKHMEGLSDEVVSR